MAKKNQSSSAEDSSTENESFDDENYSEEEREIRPDHEETDDDDGLEAIQTQENKLEGDSDKLINNLVTALTATIKKNSRPQEQPNRAAGKKNPLDVDKTKRSSRATTHKSNKKQAHKS